MRNAKLHRDEKGQIFFDDGEHGLEVEHMDCLEESGHVSWSFWFTIMGNHAYLSYRNAHQLVAFLTKAMEKRHAKGGQA